MKANPDLRSTEATLDTIDTCPERGTVALSRFDPQSLRLSQDFAAHAGAKRLINTIPVRKPGRQSFVRTHPSPGFWLETTVLELKEERETYLVDPALWPSLAGELIPKVLVVAIDRQGTLFLWPIRLPGEDGRIDDWNAAALEAARLAQGRWIRLAANLNLGAYDVYEATGKLPEPEWPDLTLEQMLEIAFRGHYIDTLDHPVTRRLAGTF